MKPPKLTAADWVEIYYALLTKVKRIEDFGNNEDVDNKWISHLNAIARKIGYDGKNMTGGK